MCKSTLIKTQSKRHILPYKIIDSKLKIIKNIGDEQMERNPSNKQCFVETHKTELQIKQLCNGNKEVYFWDKTDNHNKTLITLTNNYNSYGHCKMELIVNGISIETVDPGQSKAIQIEDVRCIAIKCNEFPPKTITKTIPCTNTIPTKTITKTIPCTNTIPTKTITKTIPCTNTIPTKTITKTIPCTNTIPTKTITKTIPCTNTIPTKTITKTIPCTNTIPTKTIPGTKCVTKTQTTYVPGAMTEEQEVLGQEAFEHEAHIELIPDFCTGTLRIEKTFCICCKVCH